MTISALWPAAASVALAAIGGLAAPTQQRVDPAPYRADAGPTVIVYVSYNWFHSDLDVPTAFLASGSGPSARAVTAAARGRAWTVLGWGDANFYQGRGAGPERLGGLIRSALWPWNRSVVHVMGTEDPGAPTPGWRTLKLTLSRTGAEGLRRRLDASFVVADGRPVSLPPVQGVDGIFYRSGENAWALHVCNHWTGELLHAAGVPVTPVLDLTTAGLSADLRWRAHARRVDGGA